MLPVPDKVAPNMTEPGPASGTLPTAANADMAKPTAPIPEYG